MALLRITDISQLRVHLAACRRAEGLTQAELAKRLGVSHSRISQIETAPEKVTVAQFLTLLRALRIELRLATGDSTRPPAQPEDAW